MKFKLLLCLISLTSLMQAKVTLPSVFSDNMVLQQNSKAAIWGWSDPHEEITITPGWSGKSITLKADKLAQWSVFLEIPAAGGPYTLTIKGHNEITLHHVMLGEVWLCSGQSNMEMSANWGILEKETEIASANYPMIRFYNVPKLSSEFPQQNLPAKWEACTPETMRHFSAAGYFFARKLQQQMPDVAIGVILSAWGGTPAEVWMPESAFTDNKIITHAAAKLSPAPWGPIEPGRCYNAMIHPIAGYEIAGVLWYQGESNVGSDVYEQTFSALIESWRVAWGKEFPFYFAQISPVNYENDLYSGTIIRNEQRKVANSVAKTAMVVTSDVATINDIHPPDKKTVGERFANIALAEVYGKIKSEVQSPVFTDYITHKNKIILSFDNADGLHFKAKKPQLFEIAAADGIFFPATAKMKNNKIELQSGKVSKPVKVRYAWKNTDVPDIFNGANLPLSSFVSE